MQQITPQDLPTAAPATPPSAPAPLPTNYKSIYNPQVSCPALNTLFINEFWMRAQRPPTLAQSLQALGGPTEVNQALTKQIQMSSPAQMQQLAAQQGGEAGMRRKLQQMALEAPIDEQMLKLLQWEERHQLHGIQKPAPEIPPLQSAQFRNLRRIYSQMPENERQILRETLEYRKRAHHWANVGMFTESVGVGLTIGSGEMGAGAVPIVGAIAGGFALHIVMIRKEIKHSQESFQKLTSAYTARTGQPVPNDLHWLLQRP